MSWFRLTSNQVVVLNKHVRGKTIHEIFAGDGRLARIMASCGAEHVYAVDRNHYTSRVAHASVTHLAADFIQLDSRDITHLVMAWPPKNHGDPGTLLTLLASAKTIVYLGKNTDGTACGYPDMFRYLKTREVFSYCPDRKNTLIVYGPRKVDRAIYGEEIAGMDEKRIWSYTELEK